MTAASYAKQFGLGSRKNTSNSFDIGMDIKTFGASSSSSQNPELIQVYLEAVANALDTRATDDRIR